MLSDEAVMKSQDDDDSKHDPRKARDVNGPDRSVATTCAAALCGGGGGGGVGCIGGGGVVRWRSTC